MESFSEMPLERLGDLLLRSQWPGCKEIAQAIAQRGGEQAKLALLRALRAKRHHVRTAAVEALASMGDPAVIPDLLPLLKDRAYETRTAAAKAIEALGGRAAADLVDSRKLSSE